MPFATSRISSRWCGRGGQSPRERALHCTVGGDSPPPLSSTRLRSPGAADGPWSSVCARDRTALHRGAYIPRDRSQPRAPRPAAAPPPADRQALSPSMLALLHKRQVSKRKGFSSTSRMGWPLKELSSGEEGAHRHAVLGECSGLVGADHRRRSQGLDGGEILHQGIASRHPLAGHGEGQGDRRGRPSGTLATRMPMAKIKFSQKVRPIT